MLVVFRPISQQAIWMSTGRTDALRKLHTRPRSPLVSRRYKSKRHINYDPWHFLQHIAPLLPPVDAKGQSPSKDPKAWLPDSVIELLNKRFSEPSAQLSAGPDPKSKNSPPLDTNIGPTDNVMHPPDDTKLDMNKVTLDELFQKKQAGSDGRPPRPSSLTPGNMPTEVSCRSTVSTVLRNTRIPAEDRMDDFAYWFSLLPSGHRSSTQPRYLLWQTLFNAENRRNTGLMLIAARIGMSKGYLSLATTAVYHVIYQRNYYVEPFLDAMEEKAKEAPKYGYTHDAVLSKLHSAAILAHCQAGRLGEALKVLQRMKERKIYVPHPVRVCIEECKAGRLLAPLPSNGILLHLVNARHYEAASLMQTQMAYSGIYIEPNAVAYGKMASHYSNRALTLDNESRAALFFDWLLLIPSGELAIRQILHACVPLCQKAGPQTLFAFREKALWHPDSAALWIQGEMAFHKDEDPKLALQIFLTYCELDGPLRSEILRVVDMEDSQHNGSTPLKIQPTRFHIALVVDILLQFCSWPMDLEHLYSQYLATISNASPFLAAQHFNSFIRKFGELIGPDRAALVLRDIIAAGAKPNRNNFAGLAAAYARAGDIPNAMGILADMERGGTVEGDDTPAVIETLLPTAQHYAAVMQGFVYSRCLGGALSAERSLMKRKIYQPGSDRVVEDAVTAVRHLWAPNLMLE